MREDVFQDALSNVKSYCSKFNGYSVKNLNNWWLLGYVFFFNLLFVWAFQEFIYNKSLYYTSYSESFTKQTIEEMLGFQSRFWWTGYVFSPIILFFKFLYASICINIGAMISVIDIKFRDIFKTVMLAEVVFIIGQAIFLLSLYFNLNEVTLQNISGYYPLSALYFIGIENVNAQWAIYPLQTINLFETLYIAVIAWILSKQHKFDFIESLSLVIPSYGLGLLLWVVLVAFLTLQIS